MWINRCTSHGDYFHLLSWCSHKNMEFEYFSLCCSGELEKLMLDVYFAVRLYYCFQLGHVYECVFWVDRPLRIYSTSHSDLSMAQQQLSPSSLHRAVSFSPPILVVTTPPARSCALSSTKTPPLQGNLQHTLTSWLGSAAPGPDSTQSDRWLVTLSQLFSPAYGFASRLSAADPLSVLCVEDVLLKVSPWSGRMSSFGGNSAPDGRNASNRMFTVSVSVNVIWSHS